jgi:tetratricopeptide (TPR) repeat protein
MESNLPMAHLWLGQQYFQSPEDFGKAIFHLQKAVQLGITFALGWLGWALAHTGKKSEAEKMLDRLNEIAKQRYISPFQKGLVLMGLDQLEEAFKQLKLALKEREPFLVFLLLDVVPGPIRSDPRCLAILEKIGLEAE